MELSRKLKIYAVLTFLGLVMMTLSFVSPGWSSISIHKAPPKDFVFENGPIAMEKRSTDHHHHRHHHRHHHGPHVHLALGLWYYVVCYRDCDKFRREFQPPPTPEPIRRQFPKDLIIPEDDVPEKTMMPESWEDKNECHVSTYKRSRGLPMNFMFAQSAYNEVTAIGKKGLLEFQIEASLALFCGVVGFVASVVYARALAQTRRSGLVACISLIMSGALYLAAVGKTVSSTEMYKTIYGIQHSETVRFHCPWGLVVGGVSALFVLISAIGHLCVLSRPRTSASVYHIHKGTNQGTYAKHAFTTIAPPGYEANIGLKVPLVSALETNEEAGPLPEKELI